MKLFRSLYIALTVLTMLVQPVAFAYAAHSPMANKDVVQGHCDEMMSKAELSGFESTTAVEQDSKDTNNTSVPDCCDQDCQCPTTGCMGSSVMGHSSNFVIYDAFKVSTGFPESISIPVSTLSSLFRPPISA